MSSVRFLSYLHQKAAKSFVMNNWP